MSKIKCPGQDTRYWKPGDIFNIQCIRCGKTVEFFKDDVSRRCPECGGIIQNPRITLGCAQWCEHAAGCLGYDPKSAVSGIIETADTKSIAGKILDEIGMLFGKDSKEYNNALSYLGKAENLLKDSNADPGIVLPSVLVLSTASSKLLHGDSLLPSVTEILQNAGIDRSAADVIHDLISGIIKEEQFDTPEYDIVYECCKSLK